MIRVHHLDTSRSFRVLWLLEELGLEYEVVPHRRDAKTRLAPPSLLAVHPLGKAPVIEDEGAILFESGAILDTIVRRHGGGRLAPERASAAYDRYQAWLHYAEGSAMLPVMLNLYATRYGAETPPLRRRIDDEVTRHRDFVATAVAEEGYLAGSEFTAADINMAMVAEMLDGIAPAGSSPALADWLARLKARPAYLRALERGGDPAFRRDAGKDAR